MIIRCHNAEKRQNMKELLDIESVKINFEFTETYTEQNNDISNRIFGAIYGRARDILKGSN